MEKMAGLLLLLLAVINFAVAQETPTYVKTGAKLTLDLSPRPTEKITNILWKFNGDLLAEWVDVVVPLDYYDPFKGRTVLDIKSGRLEINKTTEADQGVYTVEVNNKVQSVSYKAMVIEDPNKPTVETQPLKCSPDSHESCTMSCETDTTKTGPLIYSWKKDDGEWKEAEQKLPITKADDSGVKTFTCRVKNLLGVLMESDPGKNQLFKEEEVPEGLGGGAIAGIIIGVLSIGAVVGGVVAKKYKIGPFKDREGTPKEDKGADPANGNQNNQPADEEKEPNHDTTLLDKQGGESANADDAIGEAKV